MPLVSFLLLYTHFSGHLSLFLISCLVWWLPVSHCFLPPLFYIKAFLSPHIRSLAENSRLLGGFGSEPCTVWFSVDQSDSLVYKPGAFHKSEMFLLCFDVDKVVSFMSPTHFCSWFHQRSLSENIYWFLQVNVSLSHWSFNSTFLGNFLTFMHIIVLSGSILLAALNADRHSF